MCVVSMVTDHHVEKWGNQFPHWPQWVPNTVQPNQPYQPPSTIPYKPIVVEPTGPTQQEFDDLKKEFEDFKKLALKAIEYDVKNNEPHCEMDEKVDVIRKLAK